MRGTRTKKNPDNNNNTNISEAHDVNRKAESEAPAVAGSR